MESKEYSEEVVKSIDILVENAQRALEEYDSLTQEDVDRICKAMAGAAMEQRKELAKMAVKETGRGVVEDKIIKNMFASEYIWNYVKDKKTVGVVLRNDSEGYTEIAKPIGVVAGVTPVTNPTSTAIFKSIICAKSRNPIIFAFHPRAQRCSVYTAKLLKDAAVKAGAPKNCIQWIESPSMEATTLLMNHTGVHIVLATGGSGMVKSAYSTGKPALGVGPGNVPCYIEKSADLKRACNDIILSKTFDNGMICASEQSVIVDKEIAEKFEEIMTKNGCYFLSKEEINKLEGYMINSVKSIADGQKEGKSAYEIAKSMNIHSSRAKFAGNEINGFSGRTSAYEIAKNSRTHSYIEKSGEITLNSQVVGRSAYEIARNSGIRVPKDTKILIAELNFVGKSSPLSIEKLSPVLSYYKVQGYKEGFELCKKVLKFNGEGHTAVLHTKDAELMESFGLQMHAGRIVINSPSSQAAIGDIYNCAVPSLTLGCGSWGKNSTTQNISVENLINIKRVFDRRYNMQWFKVPPKIYFENGSVSYLQSMENINRVLIITDATMEKLGYVQKILCHLDKRKEKCYSQVFSGVSPDPDVETVKRGLEIAKEFRPDSIIALGGGSAMDAAKAIWMFYESPELSFETLKMQFMDIRKRIYKYPQNHKIPLIAIPTTSGTGSEVTSFAVITDKKENIKYPLADYYLTPSIAIIDPYFVRLLPKSSVADTGMDVLTHAIEAYVSTMASDYTDALAEKAVKLVFDYLERSYDFGEKDPEAQEKMQNAATIAGMAFTNAFLGINHSMAHKLGGEFHIPHGRANAILLPYVIEYNSKKPTKFVSFSKYEHFIADEKYSEIANILGYRGNKEDNVKYLIQAINNLNKHFGIPSSLQEYGIPEEEFLKKVDMLSELAHQDQCTGTNPRYPLISEIKDIYLKCYYGK